LWNSDHRQQFTANNHHKDKVCNAIKFCTETTTTLCLSCHNAIHHITEATEKIYDIEPHRKERDEEQQDAADNTTSCDNICNMPHHYISAMLRKIFTQQVDYVLRIKKGELPRLECFHNGIILIVICF
jgi:tagatose-1,6-bisphosphate aldolase